MKLNSLLLLPAIITVGIMPIVSISLIAPQPAFSQEKPKTPNQKPTVTKPVKNVRGSGSGSSTSVADQIKIANEQQNQLSQEEKDRLKCQQHPQLQECQHGNQQNTIPRP
jgi:hypothetical protein